MQLSQNRSLWREAARRLLGAANQHTQTGRNSPLTHAAPALSRRDRRLFSKFGWGPKAAPRFSTVDAAIAHFVEKQPDAIAVEHGGQTITYAELDRAANRIAHRLRAAGVGRGDAVGLYLKRSIPMAVGALAAMKLGAAYIPQDIRIAPQDTLRHISGKTQAKAVLTLAEFAKDAHVTPRQSLISIDAAMMEDAGLATDALPKATAPEDLCFVLFTSGTTGQPNGVKVTHKNLCNILFTTPGDLSVRPGVRVAQLLSISFDMSAWEMLGCLGNGGTLIIRGSSLQATAERADVLIATPSVLSSIDASRCKHVKAVAVAGEPCPRPLAETWARICTFYNSCGPTETTIVNTMEPHKSGKAVLSIGRPTPNNTVYILDENLQPLPIGETGEMWAGGDCVTDGYLANPELTAERYRPDPFLGGERMMFRTRDLGRWTRNGELEHFGRTDDQVKIRGFRVELDSVTTALERASGCRQAATLKLDDRTLVGFVSPSGVSPDDACAQVKSALPYYCTPEFVLTLDELPRTPRGKIDRRLLMAMAQSHRSTHFAEAAE